MTLVTFGTEAYTSSVELLRYSALKTGGFDRVIVYNTSPRLGAGKGCGSYGWKPSVILQAIEECRPGDWLVYTDSTITFSADFKPTLQAATTDVLLFEIGDAAVKQYTQRKYTKPECMRVMGATEAEGDMLQLNAAVQAYKVSSASRDFLAAYEHFCGMQEAVGHDENYPLHRHDQSILTLLGRRSPDATISGDPTQYQLSSAPHVIYHHRRLLPKMKTLTVVTPTTGRDIPGLRRCMDGVQAQDVVCLRHLVVCDGLDATLATRELRSEYRHRVPVDFLDLPYNTGANRWNGHRIYAAAAFLARSAHRHGPSELIAYCDEDNWFEPDHLSRLLDKLCQQRLDAVFSLRKVFAADGKFVCKDQCESLGNFATAVAGGYILADTSTWLLTHAAAVGTASCWDVQARDASKQEADRALTLELLKNWNTAGVANHSLCYTAGSGGLSVKPDYFQRFNTLHRFDFGAKPDLYLFHMSPEQTIRFFTTQFDTSCSHLLDEWNINQGRALHKHFNVIDGFALLPHIPRGATVLAHMCLPDQLPLQFFRERTDLRRLVYTAESPNIRHQRQWHVDFLQAHFTDVLTFWRPLLDTTSKLHTRFCPHQCHHFDEDNPMDMQQLRTNCGAPGSVCMVLEHRTGLEFYDIDGVKLQCLDGLRSVWARRIGERDDLHMTVHGRNWIQNGPWQVESSAGKYADRRHAVDILAGHSAALIVENTNAQGYVSEKFYDALIAGAVPIFYNGSEEAIVSREVAFNLAVDDISAITAAAINEKRQNVMRLRETILRTISCQAYANIVSNLRDMRVT